MGILSLIRKFQRDMLLEWNSGMFIWKVSTILENMKKFMPETYRGMEIIRKSNESGNVVEGNIITVDCKNNIIQRDKKLIAAVGIEGMIIVDTEDATLICDKGRTGDIKKVLENLKLNNRDGYI